MKALVTDSSALRIEAGRDILAGRVTQVDLGTLLPREIIAMRFGEELQPFLPDNGLEVLLHSDFWRALQDSKKMNVLLRDKGFKEFSQRGGYPIAPAHPDIPWPEIADQLNETLIQRAIQHDLRVGRKGQKRDLQLLAEVYPLSCRYAGQSPGQGIFVPEIRQALLANRRNGPKGHNC